ncbi:fungal-specific transcription factor domain-containing protein [Xylaria sp. FL1042]|nr:fungal-specific transcription factor domain-containing protein [Xylaria sp. FL1042]
MTDIPNHEHLDRGHDRDRESKALPSAKRLACSPCRERKVRCDRQQPQCSRCAKFGSVCNYSGPVKQSVSKSDLSRLLLAMNSRLASCDAKVDSPAQAEARLAFGPQSPPIMPTAQHYSLPWPDMSSINAAQASAIPLRELADGTGPILEDTTGEATTTSPADFNMLRPGSPLPITSAMLEDSSNSSYCDEGMPTATKLPDSIIEFLHENFFNTLSVKLPMVNPIAALGALSTRDYSYTAEMCYNLSRNLLEKCERHDDSSNVINLSFWQSCVLLCLYEFRRPNSVRVWMTLGRAIRLTKILGLDGSEHDNNHAQAAGSSILLPLPPASSRVALEERRRTFWQVYLLDGYTAMRINSIPSLDGCQIQVPLPCPGELHEITEMAPDMPMIDEFCKAPKRFSLSPFAATIIVMFLYRRYAEHTYSHSQEPSYPFWDRYYHLNATLAQFGDALLPSGTADFCDRDYDDPFNLILRMNLAGITIALHETAINKVAEEELSPALSADAIASFQSTTAQIAEMVQTAGKQPQASDDNGEGAIAVGALQEASPFLAWSMTGALQSSLWLLEHNRNDPYTCLEILKVLSNAARIFWDQAHFPPVLLEQVDVTVAATERLMKRRRITR